MTIVDSIIVTVVMVLFACLTSLGLYVAVESVRSNGEVDYCYLSLWSTQQSTHMALMGHRSWRQDAYLGEYSSIVEAKAAADVIQCKLQVK